MAAFLSVGGAGTMLVALVRAPGAWWQGYVSEAGTAGLPYANVYRLGLIVVAVAVAVLGAVLGRPSDAGGRILGLCLGASAGLAATSGAVPCSHRCPLPPYEPTTVADVVHSAASILGLVLLAGAMLTLALTDMVVARRRLSACAVTVIVPLGAALGLTMLLAGRTTTGAVLERLALAVAVAWLSGAAASTVGEPTGNPAAPAQAPTEPTAQAPAEPTAQAPTEPAPQAPAEPAPQAPTEPTAQAPTEPAPQAPTEPAPQAPTEPAGKPGTDDREGAPRPDATSARRDGRVTRR